VAQQVQIADRVCAATIPATRARTFAAAFTPTVTRSASSASSPHRRASAITGTSPAHDTRFGSSNRAETARQP
jgi:hypothetical protein